MKRSNITVEEAVVEKLQREGYTSEDILKTCGTDGLNLDINLVQAVMYSKEEVINNMYDFEDTNKATQFYRDCLMNRITERAPGFKLTTDYDSYLNEVNYHIIKGKGLVGRLFGKKLLTVQNNLGEYGGKVIIQDKVFSSMIRQIVSDLNKQSNFNFVVRYS